MSLPQIRALERACCRVRAEDNLGRYTMTAMAIASVISKEGQSAAKGYVRDMRKIAGIEES